MRRTSLPLSAKSRFALVPHTTGVPRWGPTSSLSPPPWCPLLTFDVPPHASGPDGLDLHRCGDVLLFSPDYQGALRPDGTPPPLPVPLLLCLGSFGTANFLSVLCLPDQNPRPLLVVSSPLLRDPGVPDRLPQPRIRPPIPCRRGARCAVFGRCCVQPVAREHRIGRNGGVCSHDVEGG